MSFGLPRGSVMFPQIRARNLTSISVIRSLLRTGNRFFGKGKIRLMLLGIANFAFRSLLGLPNCNHLKMKLVNWEDGTWGTFVTCQFRQRDSISCLVGSSSTCRECFVGPKKSGPDSSRRRQDFRKLATLVETLGEFHYLKIAP
jgi:hypothetical protein